MTITKVNRALLFFVAIVFSASCFAIGLKEAKSAGLVGENSSGYLEAVQAPSAEVKALITSVNTKRKQAYEKLAAQNGIALADVETRAGQKTMKMTPPGQFIKQGGAWKKK